MPDTWWWIYKQFFLSLLFKLAPDQLTTVQDKHVVVTFLVAEHSKHAAIHPRLSSSLEKRLKDVHQKLNNVNAYVKAVRDLPIRYTNYSLGPPLSWAPPPKQLSD